MPASKHANSRFLSRYPYLPKVDYLPNDTRGESEAFAKQAYCACRMPKYARYPPYKHPPLVTASEAWQSQRLDGNNAHYFSGKDHCLKKTGHLLN